MASKEPRLERPDENGEQGCRRLIGRVAIVTGAAGGIGTAITRRCLHEGAVIIAVDRSIEKLQTSLASILPCPSLHLVACDVTSKPDLTKLVAQTIKAHGRINVLFNNAGVNGKGDELLNMTTEEWERVMAVNLTATFHLSQLVSRHMVSLGNGVIVNTTSQLSTVAVKNNASYLASKGALLQFTRAAALELAPFGVRVNALAPGVTETPMNAAGRSNPDWVARRLDHIPLRRFGTPDEIAAAGIFLASDDASYITGANLVVDGGYTIL